MVVGGFTVLVLNRFGLFLVFRLNGDLLLEIFGCF